MGQRKTLKIVYISLLTAIAIVLHMIESTIPLPLPLGVKLGFANIISLIVIQLYGTKEMFLVNFFRVIIAGLLTGSFMSYPFYISCGGVLLSSIMISIVYKFAKLPPVSISIIGAVFHNIGQLMVVSYMFSSLAMLPYIFVLLASAIPTGIFTGLVSIEVVKRVKKEKFQ